ncbi:Nuclear control of ATPase protein 2 [Smittium mucronatum]|nr:Nuclear control of ATPase protein 2 [Smittium mucronatum]
MIRRKDSHGVLSSLEMSEDLNSLVNRAAELHFIPNYSESTLEYTNSTAFDTYLNLMPELTNSKKNEGSGLYSDKSISDSRLFNVNTSKFLEKMDYEQDDFVLLSKVCVDFQKSAFPKSIDGIDPEKDSSNSVPNWFSSDQMFYGEDAIKIIFCQILARNVASLQAQASLVLSQSSLSISQEAKYWENQRSSKYNIAYYLVSNLESDNTQPIISSLLSNTLKFSALLLKPKTYSAIFSLIYCRISNFASARHFYISISPSLFMGPMSKIFTNLGVFSLVNQEISQITTNLLSTNAGISYRLGLLNVPLNETPSNLNDTKKIIETKDNSKKGSSEDFLLRINQYIFTLYRSTNFNIQNTIPKYYEYSFSGSDFWDNALESVERLKEIKFRLSNLEKKLSDVIKINSRPNFISRTWIPALVFGTIGLYSGRYIYGKSADIKEFSKNFAETVYMYTNRYIVDPLQEAYDTIRYGGRIVQVVSSKSLQSSILALQMMTTNLLEKKNFLNDSNREEIELEIKEGDISSVMSFYAQEMQNPIKSAVFGNLVPSILIQVQKANVDIQMALAALDKLLRSNELNFVFLAVAPAAVFMYLSGKFLVYLLDKFSGDDGSEAEQKISIIVRDIDIILNKMLEIPSNSVMYQETETSEETESNPIEKSIRQKNVISQGLVLTYTSKLRILVSKGNIKTSSKLFWVLTPWKFLGTSGDLINKNMILSDIRDIEDSRLSPMQRYNVLQRVYRLI